MLKLHNYLASNLGYGYILGVFAHSCNQPTFMEHLLFVENLFVNSTMQAFNLIKYLLVIHFLVHSFALSGELTRKYIWTTDSLLHIASQHFMGCPSIYQLTHPPRYVLNTKHIFIQEIKSWIKQILYNRHCAGIWGTKNIKIQDMPSRNLEANKIFRSQYRFCI